MKKHLRKNDQRPADGRPINRPALTIHAGQGKTAMRVRSQTDRPSALVKAMEDFTNNLFAEIEDVMRQ